MQNIVILGSTGSIGTSTLDVLRLHPQQFQVFALTANNNMPLLLQQCQEFKPHYALILDKNLAVTLAKHLKSAQIPTTVLADPADLAYLAAHSAVDLVMSAIVGSAGLIPTYAAARAGKRILLANKESLVAGGAIITQAVRDGGAQLIPVDSEHSAIAQALPANYRDLASAGVNKIILTASGGPFLNMSAAELQEVTPAQALKHPNWVMGQKISVDSATLMNKGLEVIEAHWLFNAQPQQLEVVIHPQSIIHSMVEYIDGSIIAQLGTPDMKTPIAYALSAPQRISSGSSKLDFLKLPALTFAAPDTQRFPCLQLALQGLAAGGAAPAVINASNEIAVARFLQQQHGFYAIPAMIAAALTKFALVKLTTIEELIELDQEVRSYCLSL